MSREKELLDCPFCGEKPEIISNVNDAILIRCSTLACVAWQHRVPIEQWNTRKSPLVALDEKKLTQFIKNNFDVKIIPVSGNYLTCYLSDLVKSICQTFASHPVRVEWPEPKDVSNHKQYPIRKEMTEQGMDYGWNACLEQCKRAFDEAGGKI